MKKKLFVSLVVALLILTGSLLINENISYGKESFSISINNETIFFPDQQPFIDGHYRTLVPIRFVSEAMGANVVWRESQGAKGQVDIYRNEHELLFNISETKFTHNNEIIKLDTKAQLTDQQRTVVPLRALTEALGADIRWVESTSTVHITDNSIDSVNTIPTGTINSIAEAPSRHRTLDEQTAFKLLKQSQELDIDLSLLLGLIRVESVFDPNNVSDAGAVGLMQLMPSTAKVIANNQGWEYSRDMLFDPEYNIKLGTTYLRDLLNNYDNNVTRALTAYNKGPVGLDNHIQTNGTPASFFSDIVLEKTDKYKDKLNNQ